MHMEEMEMVEPADCNFDGFTYVHMEEMAMVEPEASNFNFDDFTYVAKKEEKKVEEEEEEEEEGGDLFMEELEMNEEEEEEEEEDEEDCYMEELEMNEEDWRRRGYGFWSLYGRNGDVNTATSLTKKKMFNEPGASGDFNVESITARTKIPSGVLSTAQTRRKKRISFWTRRLKVGLRYWFPKWEIPFLMSSHVATLFSTISISRLGFFFFFSNTRLTMQLQSVFLYLLSATAFCLSVLPIDGEVSSFNLFCSTSGSMSFV